MHSMTLTCKCVKWKVTLMSLMVAVDRDLDTVYLRGRGPSIPHIRCNTFVSFDQDRRTLVTVYFRPIVK